MNEVFPVLMGGVVGLAVQRIPVARLRWSALVVLSLIFGVMASVISGEIELSLGFIPVDVLQVLVVSLLTAAVATAWRRRTSRA